MPANIARLQFLPFRDAAKFRPASEGAATKIPRPSPLADQEKFGDVTQYIQAYSSVSVVGGDHHCAVGGDHHGRVGGDVHGHVGGGISVPNGFRQVGTGYHPDLPDVRDRIAYDQFPQGRNKTKELTLRNWLEERHRHFGGERLIEHVSPPSYRLAEDGKSPLPAVEDQGNLQSCTANGVIAIVEYLVRRYTGQFQDFSRLFLYKTTRRLLGWEGDSGAYIRTTIKALRLFGVPPESDWPYNLALLDQEPGAYHYSYAQNYKSLSYARLDPYGTATPESVLNDIKKTISHNFPVVFGFPVYDSINNLKDWVIPMPTRTDKLIGGHAVVAVGYDSKLDALIIRNSWGLGWGDLGYAYLPFDYIRNGLAVDFWTLYDEKWIDLEVFEEREAATLSSSALPETKRSRPKAHK